MLGLRLNSVTHLEISAAPFSSTKGPPYPAMADSPMYQQRRERLGQALAPHGKNPRVR